MSTHVAILIVGYRNASDIQRCIASLETATHRDFEIVVCENGGDAAFAQLQAAIPLMLTTGQRVQLVKAPNNGGYASGVNIALTKSPNADTWWILNPDTEPSPDAMAVLIARYLQGYDAVGAAIHFPTGEVQSFGGVWLAWQAKAISIGYGLSRNAKLDLASIESRQNFLSGASMFVGRRFVQVTGPMAERYFLYCEEVDWFLQARARGMRLGFAPNAIVVHHQGTATGYSRSLRSRSCRAVYLDERNKMLLTRNFYPGRLPVAAALALARLVGRYARDGAFRQISFGICGWFMGLCGQSGIPHWPGD